MYYVIVIFTVLLQNIIDCYGVSLKEQLEHIAQTQMENRGSHLIIPYFRRHYSPFQSGQHSVILGAPSQPSHLPEAEPILPGHTLIRPALGMLKSAVKFPHKDWRGGSGVYGNIDNLGITWAGSSQRLLYTGFRRMNELPSKAKILILLLVNNADKVKKQFENVDTKHLISRKGKKKSKRNRKGSNSHRIFKAVFDADRSQYDPYDIFDTSEGINEENLYSSKHKDRRFGHRASDEVHNGDISTEIEVEDVLNPPQNHDPNPKLTWFLGTADLYNHIKINPDAPEWTELLPKEPDDDENVSKWSFFQQHGNINDFIIEINAKEKT